MIYIINRLFKKYVLKLSQRYCSSDAQFGLLKHYSMWCAGEQLVVTFNIFMRDEGPIVAV